MENSVLSIENKQRIEQLEKKIEQLEKTCR